MSATKSNIQNSTKSELPQLPHSDQVTTKDILPTRFPIPLYEKM
jgi:hypothetical protein